MINLGLVGYPLEHSLSPSLHQAALEELNVAGSYRLFPISPSANLETGLSSVLRDMQAGRLTGLNVTIPYKQTILKYLDDLTPEARRIGAANTIFLDGGKVVGDNTDAEGFYHDLCRQMQIERYLDARPGSRIALVLGAGGAARAVVYALTRNGWAVWIAARRYEQADNLRTGLLALDPEDRLPTGGQSTSPSAASGEPGVSISIIAWDQLRAAPLSFVPELIVNTTSLGMWPHVEQTPWQQSTPWPGTAFIYDLVYNPPITRWVREARSAGYPAATGTGMLVEQAALAFERWTGLAAPRERMRLALETGLERLTAQNSLVEK